MNRRTTTLLLACATAFTVAAPGSARPAINVTELDKFNVLVDGINRSMVIDAAAAVMFRVHGVDANPPPKPYDHPYTGPVQIVEDLPADEGMLGWTDPPKVKGGKCIIHLAPLGTATETEDGIELLEVVGRPKLIRHEMGHCNGLVHPTVREVLEVRARTRHAAAKDSAAETGRAVPRTRLATGVVKDHPNRWR